MSKLTSSPLHQWLQSQTQFSSSDDIAALQNAIDIITFQTRDNDQATEITDSCIRLINKSSPHQISATMLSALICYFVWQKVSGETTNCAVFEKLTPSIRTLFEKLIKTEIIDNIAAKDEVLSNKQNQNLRRMLLCIVEDPRVIVIKLINNL